MSEKKEAPSWSGVASQQSVIDYTGDDHEVFRDVQMSRYEAILLARIHVERFTQIERFWHFTQCTGGHERYVQTYSARRLSAMITAGLLTQAEVDAMLDHAAEDAGLNTPAPDCDY